MHPKLHRFPQHSHIVIQHGRLLFSSRGATIISSVGARRVVAGTMCGAHAGSGGQRWPQSSSAPSPFVNESCRLEASTCMQVASHAQKYFLREGMPASRKEKRRPSIHDIRSATEAPLMTAQERCKLRSSLQLLNRESMESIDTRGSLEGRMASRHGVLRVPCTTMFSAQPVQEPNQYPRPQ